MNQSEINTLIMLGKPGAGKGTQSGILKERLRFSIVGYGEFFREISKKKNFVSNKVKTTIEKGDLLPYWFPSYVLMEKLFNKLGREDSVILDGAARSKREAELVHEVLGWFERPYKAIYIDIPDEVAIERLTERKNLIHRADDELEHIQNRLEAYREIVIPAIEYFKEQGTLITIDGNKSMELVSKDILNSLDKEGLNI